jgi:hypothetical protein
MAVGKLRCTVAGNSPGMGEGSLACVFEESPVGAGREGLLLCALALKTRRKNENRISAKIANLTHELESIAGS